MKANWLGIAEHAKRKRGGDRITFECGCEATWFSYGGRLDAGGVRGSGWRREGTELFRAHVEVGTHLGAMIELQGQYVKRCRERLAELRVETDEAAKKLSQLCRQEQRSRR